MATKSNKAKSLSLNVQHDYISLKTPNGVFTLNRSGAKASGKLCSAFDKMDKYILDLTKNKGLNMIQAMETLLDEKVMNQLYPQWDEALPVLKQGDVIKLTDLFAKKYPGEYEVLEMKRKTCYIKTPEGKIGFDAGYMVKVK